RQFGAVGAVAAALCHRAEVDHVLPCGIRQRIEVFRVGGPGDETGPVELVDRESVYIPWLQHLRVRADNLQVAGLAEPDECIAGAVYRVTTAHGRLDAEQVGYVPHAVLEHRRGEHEMIDARQRRAGSGGGPATHAKVARRCRAPGAYPAVQGLAPTR